MAILILSRSPAGGGGGAVADGESVTRTAPVSIGTWPSASQIESLRANIDAGSNGANFSKSGWTLGGSFLPTYSNERGYSTTKSLRNHFSDADTYQFGVYFDPGATITKRYVRIPIYIESADGSPGQIKLTRETGSTTEGAISDNASPYIYFKRSWDGTGSEIANSGNEGTISPSEGGELVGDFAELNAWFLLEYSFQPDSSAGANDGVLKWRTRNLSTGSLMSTGTVTGGFWSGGSRHRYHVLQGYFGNSFDAPGKLYWDAPYSAWRTSGTGEIPFVLIGNASTYGACDRRLDSICPYTAVSGNDVTFPAYKGPNSSMSGLYAYFMNGIDNPFSTTGVAI